MRLIDLVNMPVWLSLFLGVILPTVFYSGLTIWVQRRTEKGSEFFHGESARVVGGYFVNVVGLILGLILVNAVNDVKRAEENVLLESQALKTLTRLIRQFPPADQTSLLTIENQYIAAIIQKEWPAMRSNDDLVDSASDAGKRLDALYAGMGHLKNLSSQQAQISGQALNQLNKISELRRTRLWLATGATPDVIWLLMLFVATLALLVLSVNTSREATRYPLLVGAYALTLTTLLYFVAVLQYPFSGPIQVASTPLQSVRPLVSSP